MKSALSALLLALMLLLSPAALAEALTPEQMLTAGDANMMPMADDAAAQDTPVSEQTAQGDPAAREAFIDDIIALAQQLYEQAGGRAQRAQYSGDIYICKNFTVHLFRETRDAYRMAAYPDTELVIPNNQTKEDCAPYVYGVEWQDISAEEGNPF